MSLDATKKLPTLRPSRDLKLTGTNKPKKVLFTPNIPNNRKRPAPSENSEETSERQKDKRPNNDATIFHNKLKTNSSNKYQFSKQQFPDSKREIEMNKRRNNVFVTTSIFSCGLAEKVIKKSQIELDKKADLILEQEMQTDADLPTSSNADRDEDNSEEHLDPYDDSIPRVLPLDRALNAKILGKQCQDDMLSLWNSKPRMLTPPWPGLDPIRVSPGHQEIDKSFPSELFNSTDDKAQILFLQLPDKFPIKRPRKPDETEMQYLASHKHGKAELSGLKDLPQGSLGNIRIHESGRVSMKIGDATFDLLNATPADFLQELVVIDHPPGSAQGHLTHLGYLSGRMVCAPDLEALASDLLPS
ncbi:DNA-directed RNA polymerase III subunit RPC4-like [Oopsacas minuta]|uniref:DNA-directed RNA polymerase III subunit RPC4-like n=1 Tax=Oopsacas minuta TaxID=111878 RepID=A0AAV7JSU3_9METZ|nr:DNA-directed RNA polymerase III subunit RPC4-like [Oopsacas minuta]